LLKSTPPTQFSIDGIKTECLQVFHNTFIHVSSCAVFKAHVVDSLHDVILVISITELLVLIVAVKVFFSILVFINLTNIS